MIDTNLHFKPPHPNLLYPFQVRQFRPFKRRRLKLTTRNLTLCCSSRFFEPFHNFLSQNPLDFVAPVLGLASGLTLCLSQFKPYNSSSKPKTSDIGEWILFTSPTPFNRFVLLRCPSISFEGSELLEDVNEKLVEEDRHFVRLNSGRIHERRGNGWEEENEEKLEYQRVCVNTEDGGVISLDWPANLDLEAEHGLDTTLLLVPGTPKGSMEENVRSFVVEALKRGYFPVVMNPRGCAGSPITTARLFTAADSDDICTAIQFINNARPWTTLMGVGWGYGANMLTKYLAEVGERTPLTAATCINSPFDLEEVTRCSPYHVALDQKLTGGLIDILQSNKELFQGRAKGFDVEKALLAKSVRDFEKAISMVSYGFKEIEDFYSKSSTQGVVGNVKIPVLFIQNDDGTVPLFSIPRSLIAENPFTSLLLCSCVPSSVIASGRAAISWCQNLTIEWLTAVELGLLKGRHPLLKDVDVNITPSKDLALVEGRASNKGVKSNKLLSLTLNDAIQYTVEPVNEVPEDSNTAARLYSRSRQDSHRNLELEEGLQEVENGVLQQASTIDAELIKEDAATPVDSEIGQVLQTAQVVMNMLDLTTPGTLSEEEKKKVLNAVGQGETLMKALQDAVPEEVREKLTTSVSAILRAQRTNLKFDGLLSIGKIPNGSPGLTSKIQEKVQEVSSAAGTFKGPHSSEDQMMKKADDFTDGSGNNQPGSDKSGAGLEPELLPSKNIQKCTDSSQSQAMSSQQGDTSGSLTKGTNELGNNHESDEVIKEKAALYPDNIEKGLEASANPNFTSRTEKAGSTEEAVVDESKMDQDGGIPQLETKRESNTQKNEVKTLDSSADQNKMVSASMTEVTLSPAGFSPDSPPMEREGSDDQMKENKTMQPVLDQNKLAVSDCNSPTFGVVQALDALTGMDDSTQVAVNSVFGVIENMISQFEEEKDDENKSKDRNEVENESVDSASTKRHTTSDLGMQSDTLRGPPPYNHQENNVNSQNAVITGWIEEEPTENPILFHGNDTNGSPGNTASNYETKGSEKNNQLVGSDLLADYTDGYLNGIPMHITANPYGHYLYNEYFHRYLLSKMPNTKTLDLDTTTALLLDYFPEEGQWKLLEQPGTIGESIGDVTIHNGVDRKVEVHSAAKVNDPDSYIEPSYVVLDTEKQQEPVGEYSTVDNFNESVENGDDRLEELMQFVRVIILDALRIEAGRKLSAANMKEMESNLARDLEQVANAVSLAVARDKDHTWCFQGKDYGIDCTSEKVGTLHGEHIVSTISSAVLGTSYLRRLMPIGVIIGSSLAALRKYFNVATMPDNGLTSPDENNKSGEKNQDRFSIKGIDQKPTLKNDHNSINSARGRDGEEAALKNINDSVMVGAVTAALGASALLVQQQNPHIDKETEESSAKSFKDSGNYQNVADKIDEAHSEKHQSNIVTSLAEKAMSVAGPVVPTKEDGEVDQERLVAMLADLGQKGGVLKLVGKIALLWGGIRGAMSLTDRLILFLHIAERPLYLRILGFVGMVLVLWSPVIVPLLPTLVQSRMTSNPSRFVVLVCIIGLYTAVMILVMLWGRRIRGYEDPLKQYGLDLTSSPKVQSFLKALIGGVLLVLSIQSINTFLGCVSFSWPSSLPSSSLDVMTSLKAYGRMILVVSRGIITATCVVLVEELLFRAWLPEEIAADLGYHQGIIISGLAFSLFQRSLWAIPGLWLFSLALAGFRQRSQGSLSIPIGLRTGIMASSFVLQTGGFLTHKPKLPLWVSGTHPLQPFSGAIGFAFSLLLAIIFYPRQPLQKKKKLERTIQG